LDGEWTDLTVVVSYWESPQFYVSFVAYRAANTFRVGPILHDCCLPWDIILCKKANIEKDLRSELKRRAAACDVICLSPLFERHNVTIAKNGYL